MFFLPIASCLQSDKKISVTINIQTRLCEPIGNSDFIVYIYCSYKWCKIRLGTTDNPSGRSSDGSAQNLKNFRGFHEIKVRIRFML